MPSQAEHGRSTNESSEEEGRTEGIRESQRETEPELGEHPASTHRGVPLPPLAQPAWQAPTCRLSAPKAQPPHLPIPGPRRRGKPPCPLCTLPQEALASAQKGAWAPQGSISRDHRGTKCALQVPRRHPPGTHVFLDAHLNQERVDLLRMNRGS